MRIIAILALLLAGATTAFAQYGYSSRSLYGGSLGGGYGTGSNPSSHYVHPYYRSNGTFVGGHYQTNPNGTQYDNFGTRGNYNPFTGHYGTRPPHY